MSPFPPLSVFLSFLSFIQPTLRLQQVAAIRVDERGQQARALEACVLERRTSSGSVPKPTDDDDPLVGAGVGAAWGEEVFLHQLLQIARLLDGPFQASALPPLHFPFNPLPASPSPP